MTHPPSNTIRMRLGEQEVISVSRETTIGTGLRCDIRLPGSAPAPAFQGVRVRIKPVAGRWLLEAVDGEFQVEGTPTVLHWLSPGDRFTVAGETITLLVDDSPAAVPAGIPSPSGGGGGTGRSASRAPARILVAACAVCLGAAVMLLWPRKPEPHRHEPGADVSQKQPRPVDPGTPPSLVPMPAPPAGLQARKIAGVPFEPKGVVWIGISFSAGGEYFYASGVALGPRTVATAGSIVAAVSKDGDSKKSLFVAYPGGKERYSVVDVGTASEMASDVGFLRVDRDLPAFLNPARPKPAPIELIDGAGFTVRASATADRAPTVTPASPVEVVTLSARLDEQTSRAGSSGLRLRVDAGVFDGIEGGPVVSAGNILTGLVSGIAADRKSLSVVPYDRILIPPPPAPAPVETPTRK